MTAARGRICRQRHLSKSEVAMGRRPQPLDPAGSAAALFGAKLRKQREAQGWTQEQLGEKVFCTGDQISKIELAKRTPSWELAVALDRIFGTGEAFQELWPLVNRETLPEWFRPYPELEAEAGTVRTFGLVLIHGLMQTENYAREIFRTGETPEKLDQLLAARLRRQEILASKEPPAPMGRSGREGSSLSGGRIKSYARSDRSSHRACSAPEHYLPDRPR
jgi:transcriptional regulator with XRE-family HTH domain